MNFRTEINIPASASISYADRIFLIGSCFAENVAEKFTQHKYRVDVNPFGILYNPLSIANALENILDKKLYTQTDLVLHNGLWHSLHHHGCFSNTDADICLEHINQRLAEAHENITKSSVFIVTFGSAWVYCLKDNLQVVGNCHKMPENLFTRRKLSVNEIVTNLSPILNRILNTNSTARFIFTVSPIRHKRDGYHQNMLSKATLLLAIDELQAKFPSSIEYFPSFEIMMDDLRDYRFYAEDMIHPNDTAISYIWERFCETYFSPEIRTSMQELYQFYKAENHRLINENSPETIAFRKQLEEKRKALRIKYPNAEI